MDEKSGPINNCQRYFVENRIAEPVLLTKAEFDKHCCDEAFSDGPFCDTFGDGYGEPYNPNRQVFGVLKDGRGVYFNRWAGGGT